MIIMAVFFKYSLASVPAAPDGASSSHTFQSPLISALSSYRDSCPPLEFDHFISAQNTAQDKFTTVREIIACKLIEPGAAFTTHITS